MKGQRLELLLEVELVLLAVLLVVVRVLLVVLLVVLVVEPGHERPLNSV